MMLRKAYTSGRWMMTANFGLLLASLAFIYAVKTTTAANASFLGSITPLAAVVLARFVLGERLLAGDDRCDRRGLRRSDRHRVR